MFTIVAALHILVCVFLIVVVLLQTGRGSEIGAVFGGAGSQALFGAQGPGTLLGKVTAGAAAIFMITSLLIGANVFTKAPSSIMNQPATEQSAPATDEATDTEAPAATEAPAESQPAPQQ